MISRRRDLEAAQLELLKCKWPCIAGSEASSYTSHRLEISQTRTLPSSNERSRRRPHRRPHGLSGSGSKSVLCRSAVWRGIPTLPPKPLRSFAEGDTGQPRGKDQGYSRVSPARSIVRLVYDHDDEAESMLGITPTRRLAALRRRWRPRRNRRTTSRTCRIGRASTRCGVLAKHGVPLAEHLRRAEHGAGAPTAVDNHAVGAE
jgi:hypothetical protein